ncbi:MAG: SURF1 family protein [Actinomycetota bacterium]|nr:SURF1 family protein [Actinomycetota bacterium]
MAPRFDRSVLSQPRWILAIVVGLLVTVGFARLGLWQLDRLEERQEFNVTVAARMSEAPRPLEEIVGQHGDDTDALLHRRVIVEGTYRSQDEFFSIGRTVDGVTGTLVVTPLDRPDGSVLIVVRGLVPPDTSGPPADGFAPSGGPVTVTGRIDDGEEPSSIAELEPADGHLTSLSRLDLSFIDVWVEGDVMAITLILEGTTPPNPEGIPLPIPPPELSEGSHLGYAVQWFAFAAIASIGVGVLVWRAGTEESATEDAEDPDSLG